MPNHLEICEEAARAGADVLARWQGRIRAVEKAPADLVTEADLESQAAIQDIIRRAFPAHGFVGEESGGDATPDIEQGYRWIVDPLDGTTNYVHGLPNYCVSVGLALDGRLVAGCVYDPVAEECFLAEAGRGATLNGEAIQPSGVARLGDALVAVSFGTRVQRGDPEVERFLNVVPYCQAVRRMGSCALNLAYVAMGRLDGYWATTAKSWDVAAGALLVMESGALITNLNGDPFNIARPWFVASSTEPVNAELLPLLKV